MLPIMFLEAIKNLYLHNTKYLYGLLSIETLYLK
jgi:hypothetical protein